ncbi:unnamed protein product (macronuclear) [Paramecium tetraurelia]|uniref:Calcineurin-like phosphoesterase domain-containing protein n=1 Tax=Paramecium tetraurelia TaxID=5888 RepID=A0CNH1_PARTE|nr:uncharacterized protein GSPATT00008780001 [Paramecium tetraurelia]CAK72338.1 unnamed protein product [Paramecium tetraurelia]|eukprot:XP_001439735.1 hypothetical protein (macronuclear) [Paramecium tetraurelia strain d4-2]
MLYLFIIIILQQLLITQQCQIFNEKILLGDYYTNNGSILAVIEFKSYEFCEIPIKINLIQLRYESSFIDQQYYVYTVPIESHFMIKFNMDNNVTLGDLQLTLRLPKKYGRESISIVEKEGSYQLINNNSIFNVPPFEATKSINVESIHYILINRCEIGKVIKDLQKPFGKWTLLIGKYSCMKKLSLLKYDAYIQIGENHFITFLQTNQQFSENVIKMTFLIHNDNKLEYNYYFNEELVQQEFVVKNTLQQPGPESDCLPYGQRISLGYYYTNYNDSNELINIAYNTLSNCPSGFLHIYDNDNVDQLVSLSEIRTLNMSQIYENTPYTFTYVTYINIVSLNQSILPKLGQIYNYQIYGDINQESETYQFKVPLKEPDNQIHKIIFFGDMDSNWTGNKSKQTFDWFQSIQNNQSDYDVLIFEGDMAYDLESLDCQQGDFWLRNMTTFTSYYPLLPTPGNHDSGDNYEFDFYRVSFLSPEKPYNTKENYYNFYSVDLGLVHYIFYNPTNIVYDECNQTEIDIMVSIMENDLIEATKNRDKIPWIIVNSHYPMYCSDATDPMCSSNFIALNPFAELFTKYGVAIYMSAHQHNYERDAPFIYNKSQINTGLITDGPEQHLIMNSAAPVYVIEGSAGQEYFTPLVPYPAQPYTVYQTGYNDGVGILSIYNETHLYFEQIDLIENRVVDYFWVVQSRGLASERTFNILLWVIMAFAMVLVIGLAVFYVMRRQMIKEKLIN